MFVLGVCLLVIAGVVYVQCTVSLARATTTLNTNTHYKQAEKEALIK